MRKRKSKKFNEILGVIILSIIVLMGKVLIQNWAIIILIIGLGVVSYYLSIFFEKKKIDDIIKESDQFLLEIKATREKEEVKLKITNSVNNMESIECKKLQLQLRQDKEKLLSINRYLVDNNKDIREFNPYDIFGENEFNKKYMHLISELESILKNRLQSDIKGMVIDKQKYPLKYPEKLNDFNFNEFPTIKKPEIVTLDKIKKVLEIETINENESFILTLLNESNNIIVGKFKNYLSTIQELREKQIRLVTEKKKSFKQKEKLFYDKQSQSNKAKHVIIENYKENGKKNIFEYIKLMLNEITYATEFPKKYNFQYKKDTKTLILDYQLPSDAEIPKFKGVKYLKTKNQLKKTPLNKREKEKLFETILYSITLNTLNLIFKYETQKIIDNIAFNGWIYTIDKATGQKLNYYILSIICNRENWSKINFDKVEPKICFKSLKGHTAGRIFNLVPIKPLLQLSKDDRRFVENNYINIGQETNLAIMDWEDFEHLVRQVFEKEFSEEGAEIKVTRASRDGGVDAVAFNPDPIKGGKIVIQAKRYTNTVNVSAVRDLYGTILNEGAIKGIIVTTSDFGPDSYNFSKDKPMTLINGSNFLYLLRKHGFEARIDILEAKRLIKKNAANKT